MLKQSCCFFLESLPESVGYTTVAGNMRATSLNVFVEHLKGDAYLTLTTYVNGTEISTTNKIVKGNNRFDLDKKVLDITRIKLSGTVADKDSSCSGVWATVLFGEILSEGVFITNR